MTERLWDLGEKKVIADIIEPLFRQASEVGIGDDAAVLNLTSSLSLVWTIDRIPEEPIARSLGIMNDYQLGRYLIAANLSDLAAMGADPLALLLAVAFPPDYCLANFQEFLKGAKDLSSTFGVPIVGGDTNASSVLDLVATALGTLTPGTALRRSGAQADDIIYVTGVPGAFGAALAYYLVAKPAGCELSLSDEDYLLSKFQKAEPRINQGVLLRKSGVVSACQDVSDGIGQTVKEIARSSRVGFELDAASLRNASGPWADEIARYCDCTTETILLGPGADFELVFTVGSSGAERIEESFREKGWKVSPIGRIIESKEEVLVSKGARQTLGEVGWQHFTGRSDIDAIRSVYKKL